LRFENVSFDSINYSKILDALNSRTRKFIEFKILANEGYKLGLEKTKEVKDKFNMWKQNYYYQLVTMEFADSANVTDDEVKTYYNQLNRGKLKTKEVNIVEVLVKDIDSAEKVLTELENGTDIKTIASKYSIKNGAENSNGESGYKPIIYFNEIGSILDRMKVGEVYGPTKVSEGYSIFKLVDIREDSMEGAESYNQIKTELENELRHLKIKNSMNHFIAKLAKEKNVSINQELLNSISTTMHNSVVFQLLGFGGRITAVPLIAPNSEWVKDWMDSLKVIP
jgi:parvulin-like peptidyl-prolyl isomerase